MQPDQPPGLPADMILPDPIALPAHAGTAIAEDLRIALVMAIDGGGVAIAAGAVQSVGQAVLQLLAAAHAEAANRAVPFHYVDVSDALAAQAHACRLGPAIGLAQG